VKPTESILAVLRPSTSTLPVRKQNVRLCHITDLYKVFLPLHFASGLQSYDPNAAQRSFHKGARMKPTDAHVVRNILIQMLVNTKTPERMDDLIPAQVERPQNPVQGPASIP
jgi:hypothetical protein